jgi:hypothetical protein
MGQRMNMTALWDTVPCSLVGVDRLIRYTYEYVIMREIIAHKLAKQSGDTCLV